MSSKFRRSSQACDNCSVRRVRCQPSQSDNPRRCQHCVDFGEQCTFNRPQRKRGARKGRRTTFNQEVAAPASPVSAASPPHVSLRTPVEVNHGIWTPPLSIDQALAIDLTEIFFEVVYPVFPLFHQSSLIRRVSRGEHMVTRSFYASVLAMCALSSARTRDGAIYSQRCKRHTLTDPSSERLFDAASAALEFEDANKRVCLDYMRAAVLLAITAIQYGNDRLMHRYLGIYHTYVAIEGLHDEANWPADLSIIETQERRRLFWSAYTLDVFTSIVWKGTVRSREASANIAYPEPMDDESPLERNMQHVKIPRMHWLAGWNFITDMYRILEHAVDHLRRARAPMKHPATVQNLLDSHSLSKDTVIDHIFGKYHDLPPEFKMIGDITYDLEQDLYGFQAANIAATLQLVRMVYFINDNATLEQRCSIASEVIDGFAKVPPAYLRAISSPLQYHLAEIGTMLGGTFKQTMTESSYSAVRTVLLNFAGLLESLETHLVCSTGSSAKLRSQVVAADAYMAAQRRSNAGAQQSGLAPALAASSSLAVPDPTPPDPLLNDQMMQQFQFPPELFEDFSWTWGFDTQALQPI